MSPSNRQFAKFLTTRRRAAGLSMGALAKQIGTSRSNVHYWESGDWLPSASQLEPLARALGVSYEDLFVKAGYDPATLPKAEPYLRVRYPNASKRRLAEAKRLFDELDAEEDKRAKRPRRGA